MLMSLADGLPNGTGSDEASRQWQATAIKLMRVNTTYQHEMCLAALSWSACVVPRGIGNISGVPLPARALRKRTEGIEC